MQSLHCIFKETTLRFENISTFGNEIFLAQTADMVHICLFLKVKIWQAPIQACLYGNAKANVENQAYLLFFYYAANITVFIWI